MKLPTQRFFSLFLSFSASLLFFVHNSFSLGIFGTDDKTPNMISWTYKLISGKI